jgi:AcrR family transcriptional regulator
MRVNGSRARGTKTVLRDPARTRERILEAALAEFAAKGFAGARVDAIAASASINKRMLYHYFGDKEGLFREVLRKKMAQRRAWNLATPDDPMSSLPYWFDLACKDRNWVRLLEWEALQFANRKLIDEGRRSKSARDSVERIAGKQKLGHLSSDMDAGAMLLGMIALSWFPVAFPQLTRLVTGQSAEDEEFIHKHRAFLERVAVAFQGNGHKKENSKFQTPSSREIPDSKFERMGNGRDNKAGSKGNGK